MLVSTDEWQIKGNFNIESFSKVLGHHEPSGQCALALILQVSGTVLEGWIPFFQKLFPQSANTVPPNLPVELKCGQCAGYCMWFISFSPYKRTQTLLAKCLLQHNRASILPFICYPSVAHVTVLSHGCIVRTSQWSWQNKLMLLATWGCWALGPNKLCDWECIGVCGMYLPHLV